MSDHYVELTGVIRGKTIELDDVTFLPDGYRVKLRLVFERDEALRLVAGSWKDMPEEMVADLEAHLTEFQGYPCELPRDEEAGS